MDKCDFLPIFKHYVVGNTNDNILRSSCSEENPGKKMEKRRSE